MAAIAAHFANRAMNPANRRVSSCKRVPLGLHVGATQPADGYHIANKPLA